MLAAPHSTTFLQLAYRADLHLLTGRWLCATTEAELRHGCYLLRQAALHYGCGRWLLDARRCPVRCPSCLAWLAGCFLPQMQHELGYPLRAGLLVLPDYLDLRPEAASVPGATLQLALFLDEGAASAWLSAGPGA